MCVCAPPRLALYLRGIFPDCTRHQPVQLSLIPKLTDTHTHTLTSSLQMTCAHFDLFCFFLRHTRASVCGSKLHTESSQNVRTKQNDNKKRNNRNLNSRRFVALETKCWECIPRASSPRYCSPGHPPCSTLATALLDRHRGEGWVGEAGRWVRNCAQHGLI